MQRFKIKLSSGALIILLSAIISFSIAQKAPIKLVTINGSAVVMQDPRMPAFTTTPVEGAQIIAFGSPACGGGVWGGPIPWPSPTYDTVYAITDAQGMFKLELPDSVYEYEIIAKHPFYYEQIIYIDFLQSTTPFVAFELIPQFQVLPINGGALPMPPIPAFSPKTSLEVTITKEGVPSEGAFVSLNGGRNIGLCPLYLERGLAKQAGPSVSYYGQTDARGIVTFDSVSLDPYIDYAYDITLNSQIAMMDLVVLSDSSGMIRLNMYVPGKLAIDFPSYSAIEGQTPLQPLNNFIASPNPFRSQITLTFPGAAKNAFDVGIYDLMGRKIADFKNVGINAVNWDARGMANGRYLIRAIANEKVLEKSILLMK